MLRINIKKSLYWIPPFLSIIGWALFLLIHYNFLLPGVDFDDRYAAADLLLSNPNELYSIRYYYLPSFVTFILVPFTLLPFILAKYVFFFFNIIILMLNILEYNKILYFKGIKNEMIRMVFLIFIANGYVVFANFYYGNFKFLSSLLILILLRRELHYRVSNKEKNIKFYFINYNLLWLAIAIIPQLAFLILIYVFVDFSIKDIFKKKSIKMYLLAISIFLLQNFMIFIYPNYLFDFLNSYQRNNTTQRPNTIPFFYTKEWLYVENNQIFFTLSFILLAITTLILILKNNIFMEYKFAFFSFTSLIFSAWASRSFNVVIPLSYLLILPFLVKKISLNNFIKKNYLCIINLLSLFGIYLMFPSFTIFKYLPFSEETNLGLIVNLRWLILLLISIFTFLLLKIKNTNINFKIDLNHPPKS